MKELPVEKVTVTTLMPDGFMKGLTDTAKTPIVFYSDIGEIVTSELFKRKRKWYAKKHISIENPSSARISPPCKYFTQCGGCDLQHLSYERQKKLKTERAVQLFTQNPERFITSPRLFHYRNYCAFNIEFGKAGFYKKLSRSLTDIDHCMLMDYSISDHISHFHTMKDDFTGEVRVKTTDKGTVVRFYPKYETKQATTSSLIFDEKTIQDITYYVSPDTFFQSNDYIIPLWLQTISDYAATGQWSTGNILDLYSGAGTISLYMASQGFFVTGVENNPLSIYLAEKSLMNPKNAHISHPDFILGDLHTFDFSSLSRSYDYLIVNPPRGGLSSATIDFIRKQSFSSLIYSSCNPETCARDVQILADYSLSQYAVIDMFPHTNHFEVVALLTKQ